MPNPTTHTTDHVNKGNRLIAEFMKLPHKKREWDEKDSWLWTDNYYRIAEKLKYHSSFDWLMPVVEKIQFMGYGVVYEGYYSKSCSVKIHNEKESSIYSHNSIGEIIDCYYYAIVQFIEWYNTNNNRNKQKE